MMKKFINIILIISLLFVSLTPLTTVEAAKNKQTLKQFKDELEEFKTKREENNRLTKKTMDEIDQKRNAIVNANNTIASNENKVEKAKVDIAESQEEIKIKNREMESVISTLQLTKQNQAEIYIDYIFTSSTLNELVEREAVVEQIINHTQEELEDLNNLIKKNEKLKDQLAQDNVTLENSITEYEKKVDELEAFIDSRASIGMDYDSNIKALESQIKDFTAAGCKDNDSLDDCYYNRGNSGILPSGAFSRPLNSGRVTQAWGNNGHKGMDIGGNRPGTNVYAPANGTIAYVKYRSSCGGNIIYMHSNVAGQAYTVEFAHLTDVYVKNGQSVRKGTVIGTVGGDSSTWWYDKCTTGAHLHYAIAYGYYLGGGAYGYKSWNTYASRTNATSVQAITGIPNKAGTRFTTRG
ncbi:MAG TPA: hypothetical protein DCE23_09525 [Firmicutes bacterium]|nr:hypothetical protein [Bacillota bacterium]